MELKALVKVGMLILLMGFTATTVDARFNLSSLMTEVLSNGDANDSYIVLSKTKGGCDKCELRDDISFPLYYCAEIKETHAPNVARTASVRSHILLSVNVSINSPSAMTDVTLPIPRLTRN
uniref:Bowman-Birk type proteinase inhibitor n=1 Tax=Cajanus cajan TaxID=3821 RepID=A0A151TBM3_CAJCA|nr:Bowman-Birk type proteinase inhibitor [Cajanus cajan]